VIFTSLPSLACLDYRTLRYGQSYVEKGIRTPPILTCPFLGSVPSWALNGTYKPFTGYSNASRVADPEL